MAFCSYFPPSAGFYAAVFLIRFNGVDRYQLYFVLYFIIRQGHFSRLILKHHGGQSNAMVCMGIIIMFPGLFEYFARQVMQYLPYLQPEFQMRRVYYFHFIASSPAMAFPGAAKMPAVNNKCRSWRKPRFMPVRS